MYNYDRVQRETDKRFFKDINHIKKEMNLLNNESPAQSPEKTPTKVFKA